MRRTSWIIALAWAAALGRPAHAQDHEGEQQQPCPSDDEDAGLDPLERLKKIQALMEQVEGRLFEAETGEFTQAEQRRIVEAMRFEEKSAAALERLIHEIEKKGGS